MQDKRGQDIGIQVLSFPAICSSLQTAVAIDQYPHLRDLDLADEDTDEGCSDSIDILIGTDYYWQVVIGDIIEGLRYLTEVNGSQGGHRYRWVSRSGKMELCGIKHKNNGNWRIR